ncbi:MAG: 3-oxoacyl-ACP reductase FabG [Myxococcota bacterium]|nr:3-oxoacyl-ACP reductase FabG [Myxococcota bacterium]
MKRRVLVTGASRGIGAAIAKRLASDGFHITINYRKGKDAAAEVASAIRGTGGEAELLAFDISKREEVLAALTSELNAKGPYYGVVCNAGVHSDHPFPGLDDEAWDRVLRTNLDGFYNVLHPLVMPMIRTREGGRIVTMSSVSGLVGNRGQVNYSASKAGIIGATRSLSLELAKRKITVNSVAPGIIKTDMTDALPIDEVKKMIPMRRMGSAEEVAAAVSFLVSDEASYITGQVLSVNGGMV